MPPRRLQIFSCEATACNAALYQTTCCQPQARQCAHRLRAGRKGMRNHAPPDAGLMKGGRSDHELPLSDRVAAIVERYITVERQELLHCESHDYVWVAQGGGPLSEKGIDFMMRSRT